MMTSPLRQKTITISATIAGSHTDFPLWISLTDPIIAARASADGSDIHFVTDVGAMPLAYEIQRWSKSEGRLDAWVRIPTLQSGTKIVVRYGDATVAHAPNAAMTFSAFKAVWHFEDQLNNATIVDAHGTNNGTGVGLGPTDSVTAQLGRGIDFNDNAEQINFTSPLAGATSHTISAWVNQGPTASNDALIAIGPGGVTNQARWLHTRFDGAKLSTGFYGNDWTNVSYDIIGDGWVLVHWTYSGTNRMSSLHVNGTRVAGPFQFGPGVATPNTTSGVIGNAPAPFGGSMGINATVDEVRISDVARDDGWIAAEAMNQTSPQTFYSVSAEQVP